jgi:hypothetical protein
MEKTGNFDEVYPFVLISLDVSRNIAEFSASKIRHINFASKPQICLVTL